MCDFGKAIHSTSPNLYVFSVSRMLLKMNLTLKRGGALRDHGAQATVQMAQHSAAAILCSCSLFSEGSFSSSLPTGNGERKALEHRRWTKGHTSTLYSKSASWEQNTAVPTWGHFPALRRAVTVPFRGSRLARVSWHEKAEVTSAGAPRPRGH